MDNPTKKQQLKKGQILVVEDDRFYQELCREVLEEEGYEVHPTFTGEEALIKIKDGQYQIIIVDLVLPGIDGLKVLSSAKQVGVPIDVILMTGYASVESAVKALKSGASDYLTKPINPEELKLSVKRCMELRSLFEENNELKSMVKLYQTVQLVSNTLELDQLYSLSLDSVLQGVDAKTGVALFRVEEGKLLELKSYRGLEDEPARLIASLIKEKYADPLPQKMKVLTDFPVPPGTGREVGTYTLMIPLQCEADRGHSFHYDGLIVAWKHEPFQDNYLANIRFITEQVSLSLENALNFRGAQEMVFVDDLTNLYNMRYLSIALDNEIKRAKRFKKGLAILFLDLDHFKEINDEYGHLAGSKLLKEVAKIVKRCVREVDIAIRYGGDEFIAILPDTDPEGALKVAERIRKKMEKHTFLSREGIRVKMTCCVGVACYPNDAKNKVDLIHLADKAMYRGKETTRNVTYAATAL